MIKIVIKKKVLTLYDIRGIQKFIFNTNKLKENIGASFLVQSVLNKYFGNKYFEGKIKKELEILGEDYIELSEGIHIDEIDFGAMPIYIAGGNSLILYKNKEIENEITKSLSKYILETTRNTLPLMVGSLETDMHNLSEDMKKLGKIMFLNKARFIQAKPLGGIGITKLENQTDLPVQFYDSNKYLSYSASIKRIYEERKSRDYYKKVLIDGNVFLKTKKDWIFPRNLDELRFREGEHHIALVHLDGNNMGELIKKLIGDEIDYAKGLFTYKQFSIELEHIIYNAMRRTINDLINNLEDLKKQEIINGEEKYEDFLPIRPIIINGDDLTFITHGLLGIGLAECLIKNVDKERKKSNYKIDILKDNLSVSGGVLITNYKFPFSRAYPILEDLSKSAKLKGKIINPDIKNSENLYSWLDIQILNSGVTSGLESLRKNYYNCPGCKKPDPLEKIINDNKIKMEQYNLLYRPWAILGKFENNTYSKFNWEINFKSKLKELLPESNNWPKSQLKKLQKSFFISKEKVRDVIIENKRRNRVLKDSSQLESGDWTQTPYFDLIELMNYYNEIPLTTEES
ncbi:MAG: hypothetical protein P8Y97_04440 [Candidatus Lokiarchaeota archaeon]